ncbi:MAG: 50S ribosomal protein L18 [Candidatus Peregrinibacteria bacterium]|nr:50S ribosomal protein L18 [Candidatus Peregrinibacteria bacterium]MDZ4245415.1 50S ribosomal protein L18 [Candidatus Gracilibacteria bacterium]
MDQSKRKTRQARIRKIVQGTSARPRLSVYKSLTTTYAQLIDDTSGVTIAAISDLKGKRSGTKIESAKNLGVEIAKKAKEKKITECVFDRSGYKYHGRVKALAEGAREGGLKF